MDELHLMMLHLKKIGGLIENFDPGVYTASKPNGNISNDAVGGLIEYFSLGGMQIYNSSVPDDVFIFNSSPDQIIIINSNLNLNDSYDVGGLIGDSLEFNSTIENSYPTGDVHGDGYNIGGLIGLYSSYSISNSTANVYYVNDLGEGALGGLLVRPVRAFSVD